MTTAQIAELKQYEWQNLIFYEGKKIEKKVTLKNGAVAAMQTLANLTGGRFNKAQTTESIYVELPGITVRLSSHMVGLKSGKGCISLSLKSTKKMLEFQLNTILSSLLD